VADGKYLKWTAMECNFFQFAWSNLWNYFSICVGRGKVE